MASYNEFTALDIRVGKIVAVEDFPEAKIPAYKLKIDFGESIGTKMSSARLCAHYTKQELIGKLALAVVNFPNKQIGPFISEVLTLGVPDQSGECILIVPDIDQAVIGGRLY
ncbi:MAG: tRNA-binding protein [Patescibacteria group bacterium]|jgi:tRNA-binding protein